MIGAAFLRHGLADADANPLEVLGVQVGDDGPEPVVTGEAAARLHLELRDREVELVVDDDELLGINAEPAGERAHRMTRVVDVRERDRQRDAAPVDRDLVDEGALLALPQASAVAGRERTLGCVITISAGMYEPGHAIRTDTGSIGFKIGEHDGKDTPRAQEIARIMNDVAVTKVTPNLWGERWSKLAVNCMVNPISGLSGFDSAEARTNQVPRRIAVFTAAEVIQVGRARGFEVEPIYSIKTQRFVDAVAGDGLAEVEADMSRDAKSRVGGRPSMLQDVMKGRRTEINYLNGYVADQLARFPRPGDVSPTGTVYRKFDQIAPGSTPFAVQFGARLDF